MLKGDPANFLCTTVGLLLSTVYVLFALLRLLLRLHQALTGTPS